jgi:two-component system, sensor histidine kinase PdtaS
LSKPSLDSIRAELNTKQGKALAEACRQIMLRTTDRDTAALRLCCTYGLHGMREGQVNNDAMRGLFIAKLTMVMVKANQIREVKPLLKEGVDLALKLGDENLLRDMYINTGNYYLKNGSLALATEYYFKTAALLHKQGKFAREVLLLADFAQTSLQAGNYTTAVQLTEAALPLARKLHDDKLMVYVLQSMGNIYYYSSNYTQALQYYQEALDTSLHYGRPNSIAVSYNNIGLVYRKRGDWKNALEKFRLAVKLHSPTEDPLRLEQVMVDRSVYLNNVGNAYTNLGQFDSALVYLTQCLEIRLQFSNPELIARSYTELATLAIKQGRNQQALSELTKADEAVAAYKDFTLSRFDLLRLQAKIYQDMGMYLLMSRKLEQALAIRDSITKNEIDRLVSQEKTKYDMRELDSEIQRLQVERVLQQRILYILVASSFLLFALVTSLLGLLRQRYRRNKLLEASKIKLEEQRNELSIRDHEKELMLKELHHRVKNNLQVISSLLSLQQDNVKGTEARQVITISHLRVETMAMLHRELYLEDKFSVVDLHSYLKNLTGSLTRVCREKHPTLQFFQDFDTYRMNADRAIQLGLIYNELVLYICRFAIDDLAQPTMKVRLERTGERLTFSLTHNGHRTDLDDPKSDLSVRLIHSLSRQLGADMQILQNPEHGLLLSFNTDAETAS